MVEAAAAVAKLIRLLLHCLSDQHRQRATDKDTDRQTWTVISVIVVYSLILFYNFIDTVIVNGFSVQL